MMLRFSQIIGRLQANSIILTESKWSFQSRTGKPVSVDIRSVFRQTPHNPDSRVSKVFNVLCLNTRRFGLRQHRLYGRAPLHGLDSTVQLYAHKEVCRHALTAMVRVGNCVRFSTSRFHPNLFLLRTRTQERRSQ